MPIVTSYPHLLLYCTFTSHRLVVESQPKKCTDEQQPAPSSNSSVTEGATISSSSLSTRSMQSKAFLATLTLVDLAGSESVKHTDATGQRLKEGANINKSLLSLGNVIRSLANQCPNSSPSSSSSSSSVSGNQSQEFVNFRDSKLTLLLKPSLSGNAKMAVICCITPAAR
jgi:Kinesin motor domain